MHRALRQTFVGLFCCAAIAASGSIHAQSSAAGSTAGTTAGTSSTAAPATAAPASTAGGVSAPESSNGPAAGSTSNPTPSVSGANAAAQLQGLSPDQIRAFPAENIHNLPPEVLQQYATPDNLSKLSPSQQEAVKEVLGDSAPKQEEVQPGQKAQQSQACAGESCAHTTPCPAGQRCEGGGQRSPGLKRFGADLFTNPPSTFAPSAFIPVPVDYVIGPGDTVAVQLFGNQNTRFDLLVQRDGSLQFPGLGPIQVAGLKFDDMRLLLRDRISKQMIGNDVSITLGALRSIQIFVVGDVVRPGSYTISSLSKMLNALFVSGGIADTGSFRHVELKRGGRTVSVLDLYDLLLRGDSSNDAELQPGDVMFVPPVGRSVSISGGVLRPAIYELKGNEKLRDVFALAGGVTPEALPRLTKIERIAGANDRRIVVNANPEEPGGNLPLFNGDAITVNTVLNRLSRMVIVKGFSNRQQIFEWKPNLHITDLVSSPRELQPLADLNFALLARFDTEDNHISVIKFRPEDVFAHPHGAEDLVLQPGDELRFFGFDSGRARQLADLVGLLGVQSRADVTSPVVSVLGAVEEPGTYPLVQNMVLKDALDAAISTNKNAWLQAALVIRPDLRQSTIHVFEVSLLPADKDLTEFKMAPGDSLRVFGTAEDRVPVLRDVIAQLRRQATPENPARLVTLGGEVKFPGEYPLVEGATVARSIALAGGFKEPAYFYDYEVTREGIDSRNTFTIKTFEINRSSNEADQLTTTHPAAEPTRRIVESDGKFKIQVSGGNIPVEESAASQPVPSAEGFALQPRDTVVVRRQPGYEETEVVTVQGEVRFPGTYRARRGETLSQVIRRAGGLNDLADPTAAVFAREELRKAENQRLQEIQADIARESARVSLLKGSSSSASGGGGDPAQQQSLLASLADRLAKAHGIGRMVIDLPQILKGDPDADVQVKNGDTLFVPRVQQEVTVLGEVNYQTAHRYKSGWSVRDYLHQSGGYTQAADTGRVYVIRANGQVTASAVGWFTSSSIKPGDTIVVPLDLDPIQPLPLFTSIASIVGNLAIAAASLKVVGGF